MRKIKLITFGFCFLLLNIICVKSQNGPVVSGNDVTGSGGSVSYSLGQIDYITSTGSNGIITEGLQQPFEISIITGNEEKHINLSASVYPNPSADFMILNIEKEELKSMSYMLFDMQGKLIAQKNITNNQTNINISEFANNTYFLKIIDDTNELKTFKIIKNK